MLMKGNIEEITLNQSIQQVNVWKFIYQVEKRIYLDFIQKLILLIKIHFLSTFVE